MDRASLRAFAFSAILTTLVTGMVLLGSRNLAHFDAALVGYTFATLFALFAIGWRYGMWLQRPPTRLYWRRGWMLGLAPRRLKRNAEVLGRRFVWDVVLNRFIWRRGRARWAGHWLIMVGCIIAAGITFPLVFGWVHFDTLRT